MDIKMQLGMLLILLSDGGAKAKKVIAEFKPTFASKEKFLSFIDSLNSSGERIDYSNPEKVTVTL